MQYKVIIDTDIGDDIDDIFALTYCLCNPNLDIKLVIVSSGDNDYKAKLVAYILEKLNRTDIPIAKSKNRPWGCNAQTNAIKDFDISNYKGIIYSDYEEVLKNLLVQKHYFFEFGPCNVLSEFLSRHEELSDNISLCYMGGSVYRGYLNHPAPCVEYNVLMSIDTTNHLFKTIKDITLLPVDCCYDLIVSDEYYQRFLKINNSASNLLLEQYKVWDKDYVGGSIRFNPEISSTILYDLVVPIYFLHKEYFEVEVRNLEINKIGETSIIEGNNIKIVTKIKDMEKVINEFLTVIEGRL